MIHNTNIKISTIVAVAKKNRAIGKNNQLLWHIPEDLKRFHKITKGHTVVMGQRTYESLPKRPLPERTNIVLSIDPNYKAEGAIIVHSLEEAIEKAKEVEKSEIFIIGGGSVYAQMIDKSDKLYITEVEGDFDADIFFPDYSMFKKVIFKEKHESGGYKFTYLILEK